MRPTMIRRFPTRLLAALWCCAAFACVNSSLDSANALLESGDYCSARQVYARIIDRDPKSFGAHYGMGMSCCAEAMYKSGLGLGAAQDWYPAIYHMNVAFNLAGGDAATRRTLAILHFNLGAALKKAGDAAAAIDRIEQAVVYDSTLVKAHNLLGALYQEAGNLTKASQCYEKVLTLAPEYALAHYNLGAVAWARSDFALAAREFAAADSLAPGNPAYQRWLSQARERARK